MKNVKNVRKMCIGFVLLFFLSGCGADDAKVKFNDAVRQNDLETMKSELMIYYIENEKFPLDLKSTSFANKYKDPKTSSLYSYVRKDDESFCLSVKLESSSSKLKMEEDGGKSSDLFEVGNGCK